jgi:3D (Asp-Asp-Asp) domain-containing protein
LKVHIFSRSARIGIALLSGCLMFSATTLSAETPSSQSQQTIKPAQSPAEATAPIALENRSAGTLGSKIASEEAYVVGPSAYVATAYSLRGRTASGRMVAKGLIAADPRHLPFVADTGTLVRGKRIDIWIPTSREAMRFGRRTVKLTVLSFGGKKRAAQLVKS